MSDLNKKKSQRGSCRKERERGSSKETADRERGGVRGFEAPGNASGDFILLIRGENSWKIRPNTRSGYKRMPLGRSRNQPICFLKRGEKKCDDFFLNFRHYDETPRDSKKLSDV